MNCSGKAKLLVAVPAVVLAAMGGQVHAMEAGTYGAPDISKFILVSEEADLVKRLAEKAEEPG